MQATRDMEQCLSDLTAYDFARASVEVRWGGEPTPEKCISIKDLSPLGQINKSKTKL